MRYGILIYIICLLATGRPLLQPGEHIANLGVLPEPEKLLAPAISALPQAEELSGTSISSPSEGDQHVYCVTPEGHFWPAGVSLETIRKESLVGIESETSEKHSLEEVASSGVAGAGSVGSRESGVSNSHRPRAKASSKSI